MMSRKTKKFTSFVMAAIIGLGVLGSSGVSEAARRHHMAPPPHHYNHHDRQDSNKKYSEGERNTAAILGVHKNTVRYRMNQIRACYACDIAQNPLGAELYEAVALQRLLVND